MGAHVPYGSNGTTQLSVSATSDPNGWCSKTAQDRDIGYNGAPIGNGIRGIEWSRDR